MSNLIYDFDYSEEKQKEIIKKVERYVPLLENLIPLIYPELKFSIESSLSHKVNLFAGYYEPKIKIIAENIGDYLMSRTNDVYISFKIKDTDIFLNGIDFCDTIYSYLPDVLYNTSLIIKDNNGEDFELDFEEYALKKEVQNRYYEYSGYLYR